VFEKLKDLRITDWLPILGILAFSACSIHSVNQLLQSRANHPTPLYTLAAGLIELATAWLVYGVVEQFRTVTKSRISKQDRRFALSVLVAFTVLAVPSLATSIVANALEFNDLLLGLLFPGLSVACAVGAALPDATKRHKEERWAQADESKRKRRATAKQAERKRAQEEGKRKASADKALARMGKAADTLRLYADNGTLTQVNAAQLLDISRQSVGQHLRKLEQAGFITRDNGVVRIVE